MLNCFSFPSLFSSHPLNMSSWNSAYPHPPPTRGRSRSRSPFRGDSYPSRPPYPDQYPQDPYRTDWEAYDRDRAWASYERERQAYDYSRRGRSRSPPPDEGAYSSSCHVGRPLSCRGLVLAGRKRRRSLSPWERSRYEPRPRYNDDYGMLFTFNLGKVCPDVSRRLALARRVRV